MNYFWNKNVDEIDIQKNHAIKSPSVFYSVFNLRLIGTLIKRDLKKFGLKVLYFLYFCIPSFFKYVSLRVTTRILRNLTENLKHQKFPKAKVDDRLVLLRNHRAIFFPPKRDRH